MDAVDSKDVLIDAVVGDAGVERHVALVHVAVGLQQHVLDALVDPPLHQLQLVAANLAVEAELQCHLEDDLAARHQTLVILM